MIYVTGIHALSLPCSLDTCGDWHYVVLRWKDVVLRDSTSSIFGDYGLEANREIPNHEEPFVVANHIRAILDMLEMDIISPLRGMDNDLICNDRYTKVLFDKVLLLRDSYNWNKINEFMKSEYKLVWLKYLEDISHE